MLGRDKKKIFFACTMDGKCAHKWIPPPTYIAAMSRSASGQQRQNNTLCFSPTEDSSPPSAQGTPGTGLLRLLLIQSGTWKLLFLMFFVCLVLNVFVYLGLRPIVDHYFIEYNNLVLSV